MIPTAQRTFPARMAMLAETAAFVEDFCAGEGVERSDVLRLTLIVEELFTNTVGHGHGGDSDAPVTLALARTVEGVELRYEDTAPAYDLLSRPPPSTLAALVETRPVGGLGIHLVVQLASSSRYAYEDGRNRLWIALATTTAAAGPA